MKMPKLLQNLFICILILLVCTVNVMAINSNVLTGFNQVVNQGGQNTSNDGVSVSKVIEETDMENYFDITLKVSTQTKIEEILKDQDLAIVIVMDISNTMNELDVTSGNMTISRLSAAQDAASRFIDDFAEYSSDADAIRQLGFVAFNTDAHQIFSLQNCNNQTTAESLKNQMINGTNNIALANGYEASPSRFTNIEGGLKRANDILNSSQVQNKYIIFISDGFPTTYLQRNSYNGYNTYMSGNNFTASTEGVFYNEFTNEICHYGTNYSDEGARRAATISNTIKSSGTKIFSIGISISDSRDINQFLTYTIDVDKEKYNQNGGFEIGNNGAEYKNWLRNSIGSNSYYDVTDANQMFEAYAEIFEQVKESSEEAAEAAWVVEDPMGSNNGNPNIEFVGLYDDTNSDDNLQDSLTNGNHNQSDTATIANNKISWNLKNSSYTTSTINGITTYTYEIKYRVRLKNEMDSFDLDTIYNTNDTTTLTYVVRNNGVLSEEKTINFSLPTVVGYLGDLTFTKKSSFDNSNLQGAKFTLVHDENCECRNEKRHPSDTDLTYEATSDGNGTVIFKNIPSGHKYILKEIEANDGYELSKDTYNIEVSYGKVTGGPEDMIFINEIKTTDLEITKLVTGNSGSSGSFEFQLEVNYNGKKLTGEYPYVITGNDEQKGKINLNEGIIYLKNNETIKISGLPVNATYTITEKTTDGYEVSYELNSNKAELGNIVTCDSSNKCALNEDGNTVKFINKAGYLLPATGSSAMLIMIIIGSILLIIPIIYIGYSFYKKKNA